MRPILPKEVWNELDKMYDTIMPHMFYTEEKGWALHPDAPQEIVEIYRKIKEFWAETQRDAM